MLLFEEKLTLILFVYLQVKQWKVRPDKLHSYLLISPHSPLKNPLKKLK